jgi:hypothetical protein
MASTIEQGADFLTIRVTGEAGLDGLMDITDDLDRIDQVTAGIPRLVDLTEVTGVQLNFPDVTHFAADRRARSHAKNVRTALLVSSDVAFGVARMYETLLAHPQITIGVFRERREAIEWLTASSSPNQAASRGEP